MSCPTLIVPACIIPSVVGRAAGSAAGAAASEAMAGIAGAIQSGIAWVVSGTVDWWVQLPSQSLTAEPAVGALQQWLMPIAVAVAVLGMIAAAGKMALTRKANPLIDVGSGLAVIAATSALGVLLPTMLLKAGDAWSSWVLNASTGGQFAARLTTVLTMPGAASGVVVVLGIVAIVMAAIQAVLMLFRQAALVILAGVLPLAAVGTLAPGTRAWFRRVTGWMLALIFYKPAAAAVYATAFTMIGKGKDPRTILMGFATVLLSLLALPVLMKFFTWTTGTAETAVGGGGFLGTMLSGAIAVGALRGSVGGYGGASAADQARLVSAQLGPQDGSSPRGAGFPRGSATPGTGPGAYPPAAGGPAPSAGSGSAYAGAVPADPAGPIGTARTGTAAPGAGGAAASAAGAGSWSSPAGAEAGAGVGGANAAAGAAPGLPAWRAPGLLAAPRRPAAGQPTRRSQRRRGTERCSENRQAGHGIMAAGAVAAASAFGVLALPGRSCCSARS